MYSGWTSFTKKCIIISSYPNPIAILLSIGFNSDLNNLLIADMTLRADSSSGNVRPIMYVERETAREFHETFQENYVRKSTNVNNHHNTINNQTSHQKMEIINSFTLSTNKSQSDEGNTLGWCTSCIICRSERIG